MQIKVVTVIISLGVTSWLGGCENRPAVTYDGWMAQQTSPSLSYAHNETVKIDLNWSRIGPFSRYETWLRANVFEGRFDIYGAQTCVGKFVRNDAMLPANGWWEIVCRDNSYASGSFSLDPLGHIKGTGADVNGEQVSFDLPIPD
ncbi:MAG: hypothetical protein KTR23_00850 [Rhodospirillales bacterium]|nr:hypothetical protein [Rhodospirillales bacterium]